jgi:hypothetical protein
MTTPKKEVKYLAIDLEYDETYAPPQEPHRPKLEDGKRYNAKITKVEVLTNQPSFNDPMKLQDLLVYTFDINGVEVKRRVTLNTGEKSNLYEMAKEFGFGNINKTGFSGKQLVGRTCRVKVMWSKLTVDGSRFDNIDIDSIEALGTVKDDEEDSNLTEDYETVRQHIE